MNRRQKIAIVVGAVVIVVLGLALATWVLGDELGLIRLSDAAQTHFQAEIQVATLGRGIRMYRGMYGRLPTDLQEVVETRLLAERDCMEWFPNDPWGYPYEYTVLSDTEYRILSRGADGLEGTEDDVVRPPPAGAAEATNTADGSITLSLSGVLVIAFAAVFALTVAAVVVLKERNP